MNVYNKILNLFIGNDKIRTWMNNPFIIENKVCATDGYALIAMSKNKINTEVFFSPDKTVLERVYPLIVQMKKEFEQVISFNNLSEIIKLVPLIDEVIEKDETHECNDCNGSGEVTYLYESKSGIYELEHECPVCEGAGVVGQIIKTPTGIKIADLDKTCKLKESIFYIRQINRLYEVMKLLGNKDITLCAGSSKKAHLFLIEDIEIIAMPTAYDVDTIPADFYID